MKITDKDRLDFIESAYGCVSVVTKLNNSFPCAIIDRTSGDEVRGKTLREAIDNAIMASRRIEK